MNLYCRRCGCDLSGTLYQIAAQGGDRICTPCERAEAIQRRREKDEWERMMKPLPRWKIFLKRIFGL